MILALNLAGLFFAALILSAALIVAIRPLLVRYSLARPNARSSHQVPTPQGGGIAVIGATVAVSAGYCLAMFGVAFFPLLAPVLSAAVLLAIVGAVDDIRVLNVMPRLLSQAIAVAIVLAALPHDLRVVPILPWWIERILLLACGIWFINLVNFMDGIDWMTVAEVVPLTAGLTAFGMIDALPWYATLVSIVLCGAMVGFAPFNRPVARLFLGDVGSLPVGLILGWLLVLLAGNGHFAAALLLPLYYLADASVTLLRRLAKGEPIIQAHRSHFYQRALTGGMNVRHIVARVFAVNIVLIGLAASTIVNTAVTVQVAALAVGCAMVSALLWRFNRA